MLIFSMWKTASLLVIIFFCLRINGRVIKKRQIFREQLLPPLGGRVPESAFWKDRLALNQLNARGIYSSTGIYLEHMQSQTHPRDHISRESNTMKIRIPPENRFVAPPGRYHFDTPRTLDTTYIIREPFSVSIKLNSLHQSLPLVPSMSLKLIRYYQQKRLQKQFSNEVESSFDFSNQANKEYAPYLKKIHEVDK